MFEPMLCKKADLEKAKELNDNWIIEPKYDGVRGVIKDGKVYDRRGNNITSKFPEFENIPEDVVLDGEIVAHNGKFKEISSRIHLKDEFKKKLCAKKKPCKFKVFDIIDASKLSKRRELLEEQEFEQSWLEIAPQYSMDELEDMWEYVIDNRREGLIVKRLDSYYQKGKRSSDWLKIKAFKEITAVFTEVEKQPKGLTLETDKGNRVVVNGAQSREVKQVYEEKGEVEAEIQYLPQVDSEEWRFPSFKRLKK